LSCDKIYNNYKTCWGHSKGCKGKPVEVIPEETENVFLEIVEQPVDIKSTVPLSESVAANSSLSIDLALLKRKYTRKYTRRYANLLWENIGEQSGHVRKNDRNYDTYTSFDSNTK
jgi:hypothetical protein